MSVLQTRRISPGKYPPMNHSFDAELGHHPVHASKIVMVAKVQVTILDEEGRILEKGAATKGAGNWWEFTCTAQGNTVIAEA
jgi:hypothetical protein